MTSFKTTDRDLWQHVARCDNCNALTRVQDLEWIADAELRLTPGSEVPAGECPECGCLAYLAPPEPPRTQLDTFTAAYIEALYFTDTGEDEQPPTDAELAEETRLDIEADCRSWWRRYGCYVTTEQCQAAFSNQAVVQAGHDFHYTRNGHGVGFWEREWPKTYRELLTQGAQNYGTLDTYLGHDGLIYAM